MGARSRREQAAKLDEARAGLRTGHSQRRLSQKCDLPRTTLRRWCERKPPADVPPVLAAFFESEEGLEWLHRQVIAAHLVITLLAGAGIRLVCRFLELSGLAQFVAASYGSQQKANLALEEAVLVYAQQQCHTLAEGMPERRITACEDETYHPQVCLVGLEPVSNFILLERYAEDRSAATWTQALDEALRGLRVEVVQGCSDEAKGLLRHVEKDLGAHHSPDLFHVQHEISKATGFSLARQSREAEAEVARAQAQLDAQRQARTNHERKRPRGRPPAVAQRIARALAALVQAERQRDRAQEQQARAREILHEIGDAYHPYDVQSGQAQSPQRLNERFAACWKQLAELAEQASLPQRARERIAKAKRVTTQLLATLRFYATTVEAKVEALNLAPEIEAAVHRQLIPAIYLERVAERSGKAEARRSLLRTSTELLAPLRQDDSPLAGLDKPTLRNIETVAGECADLFQRSSSCVEGRNGQLSLHHHGRHRLSDRRLAALTAIHNYFVRRPDGTTAAERFFGKPPDPLFDYLRAHLEPPPRPARKRPRPERRSYLLPVAA